MLMVEKMALWRSISRANIYLLQQEAIARRYVKPCNIGAKAVVGTNGGVHEAERWGAKLSRGVNRRR